MLRFRWFGNRSLQCNFRTFAIHGKIGLRMQNHYGFCWKGQMTDLRCQLMLQQHCLRKHHQFLWFQQWCLQCIQRYNQRNSLWSVILPQYHWKYMWIQGYRLPRFQTHKSQVHSIQHHCKYNKGHFPLHLLEVHLHPKVFPYLQF